MRDTDCDGRRVAISFEMEYVDGRTYVTPWFQATASCTAGYRAKDSLLGGRQGHPGRPCGALAADGLRRHPQVVPAEVPGSILDLRRSSGGAPCGFTLGDAVIAERDREAGDE